MALATVGIDGGSGIAQGFHQVDVLVGVPLEGVEVVVDEDGIGPAFVGQLKSLDEPVVARHTRSAQGLYKIRCTGLVSRDGLVDHVDEFEVGIVLLHLVHPLHNLLVALLGRLAFQPLGVLGTPDQGMKLEGEVVVLGVVVGIVRTTPVEGVVVAFYRGPLRLVLTGNLIPQGVVLLVAVIYVVTRGDVTQKLVGIGGKLRPGRPRGEGHGQERVC